MDSSNKNYLWLLGFLPALPIALIAAFFLVVPEKNSESKPKQRGLQTPLSTKYVEPLVDAEPKAPKPTPHDAVAASQSASEYVLFSNGFGESSALKGYLWFASDDNGSRIDSSCSPDKDCVNGEAARVCASGEVGEVKNQAYGEPWGAAFGWNINQAQQSRSARSYRSNDVEGLAFRVELEEGHQADMRFGVRAGDSEYCVALPPGETLIRWNDLKKDCWAEGGETFVPRAEVFTAVKWQIVARPGRSVPFNFCVENLRAIES